MKAVPNSMKPQVTIATTSLSSPALTTDTKNSRNQKKLETTWTNPTEPLVKEACRILHRG